MFAKFVNASFDPIAYLEGLHTRQLMNLRNDCFRFGHNGVFINSANDKWVSVEEVNQVLSTREHIPNKREAKEIRQKAAHAKRNR